MVKPVKKSQKSRGEETVSEAATLDLNDRRTCLKQKMTEAQQELIATLQALTPAQMDLPTRNEGWSVRHVAAHICGAESGMQPILERILNREPNQRESSASLDLGRYNNSMIKRRIEKTIPELIEGLEADRTQSLQTLDQLSEEDLELPGYHPAAGEITLYGLYVVFYRHQRIHTEDIQLAIAAKPN